MKTKEELLEQYADIAKKTSDLKNEQEHVLADLALLYEHKVGEIVKWTETNRTKNTGSRWRPVFKPLPDKNHIAVLYAIVPRISTFGGKTTLRYDCTFHPITNSGDISKNTCYVPLCAGVLQHYLMFCLKNIIQ